MNLQECAVAVAAVAVADYRVRNLTEADSNALVMMWSRHLPDVPLDWVLNLVTRHYAQADPPELTSGRVLAAYRATQRVEAAREREPALIGDWFRAEAPAGFAEYVAGTVSEWERARSQPDGSPEWYQVRDELRDQIDAEPLPWARAVRGDDSRERRCVNHDICVCTHTECRDGWLDVETDVGNKLGGRFPAVKQCPHCADAVQMRHELKPRRGARR